MYEAKQYDHLIGMQGFSETLLRTHFTLYQGYVKNTNTITETLGILKQEDKMGSPVASELRRRFGWEFNGMRLHELYFENMTREQSSPVDLRIATSLKEDFGSIENWIEDFKTSGAMRGIGWVILYDDKEHGRLLNTWITEHDCGHLAGVRPLLVMDVFEHAYILDYGLKRADYIDAFFAALNWSAVEKRFLA